jgi:hypothetical protein
METYKQTLNEELVNKVKSQAYKEIEKILFENGGSIHGGYVRDEIRGVLPEDIDVSFKKSTDNDNFIKAIKDKKEFNEVSITKLDKQGKYNFNSNIHSIETLDIKILIGYIPFIYDGLAVYISIDIVIIRSDIIIEPPFNNLDMLCNAFIKTKEGIRLSNRTGKKILDELDSSNRIIVAAEIIKLIRKSETFLCFGLSTDDHVCEFEDTELNIVALRRLLKLKDRFKFLNLPFGTKLYDGTKCEIAYCSKEDYTSQTMLAYTLYPRDKKDKNKNATYCFECMMSHLKAQHEIMINLDTYDNFTLRCPLRNQISFSKCESSFIEFIKQVLEDKDGIKS